MNDLWIAVIGILGVIIGAGLDELIRRRQRIELYTVKVFEKRMEKYEKLTDLLHDASEIANEVMENEDYSVKQRHDIISSVILPIANFVDENKLYIDSDIAAHCVATFMGAEDIMEMIDPAEREMGIKEVREMYVNAIRMIKEISGIAEIEKTFKVITKPKLTSPVIDRIRELRKEQKDLK